jgi:hypothetical protein
MHNFKGCLYRVKQINLHLSEMEILAQPLCETLLPLDPIVFTPTTFHKKFLCDTTFSYTKTHLWYQSRKTFIIIPYNLLRTKARLRNYGIINKRREKYLRKKIVYRYNNINEIRKMNLNELLYRVRLLKLYI